MYLTSLFGGCGIATASCLCHGFWCEWVLLKRKMSSSCRRGSIRQGVFMVLVFLLIVTEFSVVFFFSEEGFGEHFGLLRAQWSSPLYVTTFSTRRKILYWFLCWRCYERPSTLPSTDVLSDDHATWWLHHIIAAASAFSSFFYCRSSTPKAV